MTTRIGLISDLHAAPAPLAEALAIFRREGVEQILCAGDIAGYGSELDATVALLRESGALTIRGNHDLLALEQDPFPGSEATRSYLAALPASAELTIEGVRITMAHASPPDLVTGGLKLLGLESGLIELACREWTEKLAGVQSDILLVGHTHQVYAELLGELLVINPGSAPYNHSCGVLSLPQMEVEWFNLSGKPIDRVWSWGVNVVRANRDAAQ